MKVQIDIKPLSNPKVGDAVLDRYLRIGLITDVKGHTIKIRNKHSITKTVGDKTLQDACEEYKQLWAKGHTNVEYLVSNIEDVAYIMEQQPEEVNGIICRDYLHETRPVFRIKD